MVDHPFRTAAAAESGVYTDTLLEAGVNVCSSAAWITGGKQSPADRERILVACETGKSSIFGSGAHPGMTNMVGMVLSGACERVDEIRITESVDCSTYESAGTQSAMGFGRDAYQMPASTRIPPPIPMVSCTSE